MGNCCGMDRHEIPPMTLLDPAHSPSKKRRSLRRSITNFEGPSLKPSAISEKPRVALTENSEDYADSISELDSLATIIPVKYFSRPLDDFYFLISSVGNGQIQLVQHPKTRQNQIVRRLLRSDGTAFTKALKRQEKQLHQEILTLRQLDHPSVLQISEVLENKRELFAVSEVIHASQLLSWDEVADMGEPVIASVIIQLLKTLSYCHSRKITHNNINLSSVYFLKVTEREVQVKLAAFRPMPEMRRSLSIRRSSQYISPEAQQGDYSQKSDVWGAGAILKTLIEEMRKGGEQGSPEVDQLIAGMLAVNQEKRFTLAGCLERPWLARFAERPGIDSKTLKATLNKLRTFRCRRPLTFPVLSFVLSRIIDEAESRTLSAAFAAIDTKGDGVIDTDELLSAYSAYLPSDFAALVSQDVLKSIDFDKSGTISYSEFVLAAFDHESLLSPAKLKVAFRLLDKDRSGKVSSDELVIAIGRAACDTAWDEVIEQADSNGDGQLDFKEFSSLLQKAVGSTDKGTSKF